MKKANKIVSAIKRQISEADNGTMFFNNSFPDYDDEYVGHILSEMVEKRVLHRLCRGVYLKAEETEAGIVYPSDEYIAKAIAERDGAQILPTGATALEILGLTPEDEATAPKDEAAAEAAEFLTTGSARVVKVGERTIRFKRSVPKNFAIKGEKRKLIVQAMKAIGEANMSDDLYDRFDSLILRYPEYETLAEDMRSMPSWIKKIFSRSLPGE